MLPVDRIRSIDISRNTGATMVCTQDGVVIVGESFDDTVERFACCGGSPVVFYKAVNEEPIAIPLQLIERIETSEVAECSSKVVVLTQEGRICLCDSIDDAVAAANEAGGRICTFHKTLDMGRVTHIPAGKIKSIEVSSRDDATVVRVGDARIVVDETMEEAVEIFNRSKD